MKEFELQKKYNWELASNPIGASSLPGTRYLGEEFLGGIIFNLYTGSDGQQHGHVVNINQSPTILKWQNVPTDTNGRRSWDGQYNTSLMFDSPAKDYILTLGEGWYLPSDDELNLLVTNRVYVNKSLFEKGYTIINSNYWTSREHSDIDALAVATSNRTTDVVLKTLGQWVRGIKAF